MTTMLVGSDGSATFPDGYVAKLNTFSATLTRASTVVTGFGDAMARSRLSGVLDITGSAGGTPMKDAADTNPLGITGDGITGDGTGSLRRSRSTSKRTTRTARPSRGMILEPDATESGLEWSDPPGLQGLAGPPRLRRWIRPGRVCVSGTYRRG